LILQASTRLAASLPSLIPSETATGCLHQTGWISAQRLKERSTRNTTPAGHSAFITCMRTATPILSLSATAKRCQILLRLLKQVFLPPEYHRSPGILDFNKC